MAAYNNLLYRLIYQALDKIESVINNKAILMVK